MTINQIRTTVTVITFSLFILLFYVFNPHLTVKKDFGDTIGTLDQWFYTATSTSLSPRRTEASIRIPSLASSTPNCLATNSVGTIQLTSCVSSTNFSVYTSSPYTVSTSTDFGILASTTATSTINLPYCDTTTKNKSYFIKDFLGQAGTSTILVLPSSGQKIDKATNTQITFEFASINILCTAQTGAEWIIW